MANKVDKRYFAQVGSERIEVPADHVALHQDGASFSTSKPVLFYSVQAEIDGNTLIGTGTSWDAADADLSAQLPKAVTK